MERWTGKIAVVTGCSSGIGQAICSDLVNAGLTVIGLARRQSKIEELGQILSNRTGKFFSHQCDVSNLTSVKEAFKWIEEKFNGVHILVNNAGMFKYTSLLHADNEEDLVQTINTNLLGFIYCTKQAYRLMKKLDEHSHIIVINSVLGQKIPVTPLEPTFNIYPSSKYAVKAACEVLRQELNYNKDEKIRISSISPGLVKTELYTAGMYPMDYCDVMPYLNPEDISQMVLYAISVPPEVVVNELIVKPVGEIF